MAITGHKWLRRGFILGEIALVVLAFVFSFGIVDLAPAPNPTPAPTARAESVDNIARSAYTRGRRSIEQGAYQEAISDLNQAIALRYQPASIAYFWRAHSHYSMGNFAQSAADYTQALANDPDCDFFCDVIYGNRGSAYLQMGEPQAAIEDYTRVLSIDPDKTHIYRNRARAYDALNRPQDALQDWDQVLRMAQQTLTRRNIFTEASPMRVFLNATGEQWHINFTGVAGEPIAFEVRDTSAHILLLIRDASGQPLQHTPHIAQPLTFTPPDDDTYTLIVTAASGSALRHFNLHLIEEVEP